MGEFVRVKFLVRAIKKNSSAFISFNTIHEASKVASILLKNPPYQGKDFRIEYPSIDDTESELDTKTVHLMNLPHNINKVFNL